MLWQVWKSDSTHLRVSYYCYLSLLLLLFVQRCSWINYVKSVVFIMCGHKSHCLVSLLLLLLSRFSRVPLVWPQRRQPMRLPCPWDSPGKNTGVDFHFLLQCMKVKSESEVTQSCPTLRDPMDRSPPGSSLHGIFQARALEWGATAFSHPSAS